MEYCQFRYTKKDDGRWYWTSDIPSFISPSPEHAERGYGTKEACLAAIDAICKEHGVKRPDIQEATYQGNG